MDDKEPEARVARLACWRGEPGIAPLAGGLSNRNFLVRDGGAKFVVRLGEDMPAHHVFRERELRVSRAAAACGLSPGVVHAEPGALVFRFVEGRTLSAGDLAGEAMLARAVALVRRCHAEMPKHVAGPAPFFWVFHTIRDYARTLAAANSRHAAALPRLLGLAGEFERAAGPASLAFGHNDLLAANFIDDGARLWLIDWEYGGFNAALFDLANLATNAEFDAECSRRLLALYDGRPPDAARLDAFAATACASLLREAMWGMVQEAASRLAIDYADYAERNLARFERALAAWRAGGIPRQ